jgi:hypothetical protein
MPMPFEFRKYRVQIAILVNVPMIPAYGEEPHRRVALQRKCTPLKLAKYRIFVHYLRDFSQKYCPLKKHNWLANPTLSQQCTTVNIFVYDF